MAHQFGFADEKQLGYDPVQVDDFIAKARAQFANFELELVSAEQLRKVEFDLIKGGYEVAAVDEAISRLEDSFAKNEIQRQIANGGTYALDDLKARIRALVIGRTERPSGNKFTRVAWIMRGYNRKQVDALASHIERHLLSDAPLSIAEVRNSIFKATRGGYVEGQVDAFLDRVIELIQIENSR